MHLKSFVAVSLAAIGLSGFSAEYYVDAEHGNDSWDGSTPEIPADPSSTVGPKKTLQRVIGDCRPVSGDTVHAAPGVYKEGSTNNYARVYVPSGVTLIGDEGPEKTVIMGRAHDGGTQGCGSTALCCAYLAANAKLRRFTLTGGHTISYTSSQVDGYWGGAARGASRTTCWLYDCIVTNNFSGRGAVYNLSAVDCRFKGNKGYESTPDMVLCNAYGCFFGNTDNASRSNVYQGGEIVNCTFYGTGYAVNGANGAVVKVRNCIALKNFGSYLTLSRTYYTGSVGTTSVTQNDGTEKKDEAWLMLDENYQQRRGSPVINAAVNSYYGPSATSRDLVGRNRVIEDVMDLGAFEVAKDPLDWFVDAENGDDANDGSTSEKAHKTLARALSNPLLVGGDIVHAAPGVYADGIVTISSGARYRAIVPGYITLLADQGPEKTFILGAPDPEASANHFCGPNAVGGVVLKKNAVIRDFTLTSAYTKGLNTGSDWGAAVRCDNGLSSGETGAYVVGCVITNNVAARGAGLWGATAVRCRFNDNRASTTGADIMQGRSFSCLFGNVKNSATHNVYQGGVHVNGTFYGTGNTTEASAGLLRNCLILKPYAGANVTYSNCVVGSTGAGYGIDASSRYVPKADMLLDDDYRPRRNSPILNLGDDALYAEFPSALGNEKDKDLLGGARILNGRIDIGAHEVDSTPLKVHVDVENGNDETGDGSAAKPYQSLAKAAADVRLDVNDVIVAAPGVYSSGAVTNASVTGGVDDIFRVVVPAGVKLVSAEGPEKTFIVGAPDTETGTPATRYCGPKAVSCVKLSAKSMVKGFTLTGGHTRGYDGYYWGGAVHSGKGALSSTMDAYVVGCIVTNNCAARGAIWGATSVGCRFEGNYASTTAADIIQGSAYNCSFGSYGSGDENVYAPDGKVEVYVNCTFHGNGQATHIATSDKVPRFEGLRNCILLKTTQNCILHNCLAVQQHVSTTADGDSRIIMTEAEMKLDANYVPTKGSPALDNAKAADYYSAFAAAHPDLAALDATGGQRVYNDVMDLGACECDYRPIFAKTLKPSRLTVTEADANVTLGENCVNVPEGDGLALEWNLPLDTDCTFRIATEGTGAVTVTLDGAVLEPVAAGAYKFAGTAGLHAMTITFAGTGTAVASEFRASVGLSIFIR